MADSARSPGLSRVLAQPAHHLAQPAAHLLDGMAAALLAQLVEDRPPRLVLQDPLLGEGAALDLAEDLLHLRAHPLVDHPRPAAVVAVFGGVADRVAHPAEPAL